MPTISKTFTLLLFIFILNSCGGGSKNKSNNSNTIENHIEENNVSTPNTNSIPATKEEALSSEEKYFSVKYPNECNIENQNKFIYEVMHDSYLFSNSVDTLDYNNPIYDDPKKLLEKLLYKDDRYSFMMDAETILSFFEEGKNDNFGLDFFYAPIEGEDFYYFIVSYVYPFSPAFNAGIQRGDIITGINSRPIVDLEVTLKTYKEEDSITFQIWNPILEEKIDTTITKQEYEVQTVLHASVLQEGEHKVGYIVFQDFISQAMMELDFNFWSFKGQNIDELILDLRYNGGGETRVANHLATLIGGTNVYGKVFDQTNFNEKYAQYNFKEYFKSNNPEALNLKRVFIITTKATASSSELVINALKASANNVEVIQIGTTTYGKPYGFYPTIFCDQALLVVNVESKNSDGVGGYTNGLEPTCQAEDDIFKTFGDKSEASLKEALYYISHGECTPKETTTDNKQNTPQFKAYPLPKQGFKRIMSAY